MRQQTHHVSHNSVSQLLFKHQARNSSLLWTLQRYQQVLHPLAVRMMRHEKTEGARHADPACTIRMPLHFLLQSESVMKESIGIAPPLNAVLAVLLSQGTDNLWLMPAACCQRFSRESLHGNTETPAKWA